MSVDDNVQIDPDPEDERVKATFRIIHKRNVELNSRGEMPPIPDPNPIYVTKAIEHGYNPGQIADQLTIERGWREMCMLWAQKPIRYEQT